MKVPERWLRTFVDPPLESAALAERMVMSGLEVEAIDAAGPELLGVVIGEIVALEVHPQADRLRLARVEIGEPAPVAVVCGAPNAREGMRAPLARIGAQLPKMQIEQTRVRGVESNGMLCSAQELGLSDDAAGLLALPDDAPLGASLGDYLALDERIFTLKPTPNRADCLSIEGVAREVGAITGAMVLPLKVEPVAASFAETPRVRLEATDACGRYCARLMRGLNAAARTPSWMAQRVQRAGLRSISAIVDVTNYVMLELGQPLHAFDRAKLKGDVQVRMAQPAETLVLLNGERVTLDPRCLVIADDEGAVALAGVMGGLPSAVSDQTTEVLLESAFFAPQAIAGRSRELTIASDAAYRFERGVDFTGQARALERATGLLLAICGGEAGPVVEEVGCLPARDPVTLRLSRARRILGVELEPANVEAALQRLQLSPAMDGDIITVTPPSFRYDIAIEADLIEEVARIAGYDAIPAVAPLRSQSILPLTAATRTEDDVRRLLASRDYQEIVSFSFVDAAWERDFCDNGAPVTLANPIASQLGVMRSSLIGSLVDRARFNCTRQQERVRLFEIGRCFERAPDGGIAQPLRVGGLAYGSALPLQWGVRSSPVDLFDVRGDLAVLFDGALEARPTSSHPALHPGQAAELYLHDRRLGLVGALHPRWTREYGLSSAPVVFELDFQAVLNKDCYQIEIPTKLPFVRRDIAIEVDDRKPVFSILQGLKTRAPTIVSDIVLFDVFRGKGIDSDKKSLAFRITLQDTSKTLTEAEVETAIAELLRVLHEEFGGNLRE